MKIVLAFSYILFLPFFSAAQIQLPSGNKPIRQQQTIPVNQLPQNGVKGLSYITSVTPAVINNLCPKNKKQGDNDFERHLVYVSVNIYYKGYISGNENVLKAVISLRGEEMSEDREGEIRAIVEDKWEKEIYRAPEGFVITNLNGEKSISFSFNADQNRPGCGFKIDDCKGVFFKLSKGTFGFEFNERLLQELVISTDFRGDDFNTDPASCGCGFKIQELQLKPLSVTIKKI